MINNSVSARHYAILCCIICIILSACSVSKRIGKYSEQQLINDTAIRNAHIGISLYDPAEKKFIYNHNADKYFVPASNVKLFSLFAGMSILADSLPGIKYAVMENETVLIQGSGDPTFLHPDFQNHPVYDFLKSKKIRLMIPTFKAYMGKGWAWDDYQEYYSAQRSAFPVYGNVIQIKKLSTDSITLMPRYFNQFKKLLTPLLNGFSVRKNWDNNNLLHFANGNRSTTELPFTPDTETIVALLQDTLNSQIDSISNPNRVYYVFKTIHSQRADSFYKLMMHRSDNFYAEQTLLMASSERFNYIDDNVLRASVLDNDLADLKQRPKWVDGSGLSRYNMFTPENFITVLSKLKDQFGMKRLESILPTGGTGTLASLYQSHAGKIFAKTGTLSNHVALSGYLITNKSRLLLFSILVNNHQSNATAVRKAIERFLIYVRGNL